MTILPFANRNQSLAAARRSARVICGEGVPRHLVLLFGSASYPALTKGIGMSLATTTQPMGRVDISVSGLTRRQEPGDPGLCHAQNTITASQVHRMMEGCLKAGMGTGSQVHAYYIDAMDKF
ncbi:hypothetical protein EJB05_56049 [Eragrostis curvula]|uniref:Uncharacterized protein n=1 Tax=Eragrostis curvula TaxID=38414 RepID=A0A5J9SH42_9POAL|nr:hypothetical protein EJB05_56049 [Eragrostis curvula]